MQHGVAQIVQNLTSDHTQAAKASRLPLGTPGVDASPYFSFDDLIKRWPESNSRREVLIVSDGIDRFLVDCTRVAIRLGGTVGELYAPSGLDDLYAGVLRPNPLNRRPQLFIEKAESYRARWPWLKLENQLPCR